MDNIQTTISVTRDMNTQLRIMPLRHALIHGDEKGDRFEVNVVSGGQPVDLSDATIIGYFIRYDDATVILESKAEGNKAIVTLSEACYVVPGRCTLTVKAVIGGEEKHALYVWEGTVFRSTTDEYIDPGHRIPDLEELLAQIERIEQDIAAANEAAGKATASSEKADASAQAADEATARASASADSADEAAQNANDAADRVDASIQAATEAAEKATESAQNADISAQNADTATEKANAAADEATTAAGTANDAAQTATEAAATATAATDKANEATAKANEAADTATAAAETATAAAQDAETAADYIGNITVSATDVAPGGQPTAEKSDVDGHLHITFGLVEGKKGDQGAPNIVKGTAYDSLEALQAGVPDPAEGDQYNVGPEPPYNVYRWTGTEWEDQGKTQGPEGPAGPPGPAGATPKLSIGEVETVPYDQKAEASFTGPDEAPELNLKIPGGRIAYPTFYVDDDMYLMASLPDDLMDAAFSLSDDGYLCLEVQ